MELQPHDLLFTFDDDANRLTATNAAGEVRWQAEARNATVNRNTFGHFGAAPRGIFKVGTPRTKHEPAFGRWFVPLLDFGDHHAMRDWGRQGIGVHGGGTGLPDPFAPLQGWARYTEGCIRVQNQALAQFVGLVRRCQTAGGNAYFTVQGAPGGVEEKDSGEEEGRRSKEGVKKEGQCLSSLSASAALMRIAFPPPFPRPRPRWNP